MSADDKGTEKPSLSEIPQPINSQLRSHSSVSQPQQPPSPPDDDCTGVGITLRESPGPSQKASIKEDSFDIFDTAPGHTNTSCDQSSNKTLPPVQTTVPTLEETTEIRSTSKFSYSVNTITNQGQAPLTYQIIVYNSKQTLNLEDKHKPSLRPHSSTLLNYK